MRSFSADPANSHYTTRIHPALTSFADEVCATLARLFAYVGTLALLGIVGVHFCDLWSAAWGAAEPPVKASWSAASRSYPAFAVSPLDPSEKTAAYSILRHPQGGRKDIFRWAGKDEKPPRRARNLSSRRGSAHVSWTDDGCGEPWAARRLLIATAHQDPGFHATFSFPAALLWRGVAQLT